MPTTFVDEIDDEIVIGLGPNGPGLTGMLVTMGVTLTESPKLHDAFGSFGWGMTLRDGVQLSVPLFGWQFINGRTITEKVKIGSSFTTKMIYQVTLTQAIKGKDSFTFGIPMHLAETIGFAGVLQIARGVVILQKILFGDRTAALGTYSQSLTDHLLFSSALLRFFGLDGAQAFMISDSFTPTFLFNRSLSDGVEIASALSHNLVWQVVYPEGATFDDGDEAFANMIYGFAGSGSTLHDEVTIRAGWLDPSGGWTTWAINTRTQSVTEYQGWGIANGQQHGFNSMVKLGSHYIGANSQGIWQLDGKTDNGANIQGRMKSGIINLGNDHYTMLDSGIYLGLRTKDNSKEWILKLHTNAGEYIYRFRPKDMASTKITIGKGFRHRYFAWELITPGPDFDMDSITFLPLISKRRSN